MVLQNLTDVHTRRYAQGVQHDMYRFTTWQEGHILTSHDTGNDTLVTMAACHLIAFRNLTFLSDMYTNLLIYSRRQIIAIVTAEHLNADNFTSLAMRNAQRAITNFTSLFTKDCTKQPFFSSQLSLTFRSYLTNQNVTRANFSADADNTALVQILQRILGYVRQLTGNFFFTKLSVTSVAVILLNVDRGEYISLNQVLIQEDSILVVIAFPRHIGYDYVVTQSQLAMISCRTISQNLFLNNLVAFEYDRTLVYAGTLVGAFKFQQGININFAILSTNTNFVADNANNFTSTFCQYANAGVNCYLVLHTGTDNRSLSAQQRNCLTLHVRTHQRTVSVIVLKERDQRSSDGYYLFRTNVHQVNLRRRQGQYFILRTCSNTLAQEIAVIIQRFVGLCNDVLIFFISSHINNVFGYTIVVFINVAVRGFHKAVFVDNSKGGQRTNQTDVRTFRSLNRTHTAIVRVMHDTNFVACTLTRQTARAQCVQTAFMSQLSQRIVLVHKLGQLAAAKEFFNSSNNRTNVNQVLRQNYLSILNGHTLFNNTLHTGQTNTELVLQQLAYAANTTVAQMVNIVFSAEAVHQIQQIVEGSQNIFNANGTYLFGNTGSEQHQHRAFAVHNLNAAKTFFTIYAAFFNSLDFFSGDFSTSTNQQLAILANKVLSQSNAFQAPLPAQLFIQLVTTNACQIITLVVKECIFDQLSSVLQVRRLAGTQLFVNLDQSLFSVLSGILFQGSHQSRMLAEATNNFFIGG